jgi:hypothetical protein
MTIRRSRRHDKLRKIGDIDKLGQKNLKISSRKINDKKRRWE